MRHLRPLVPLALLLAVLAAPRPASACSYAEGYVPPPNTDGTLEDPLVISLALAGAIDATFLGLDIGYGAAGRMLPHDGAVLQGIVAVANFAGATVLGLGSLFVASDSCGGGGNRAGVMLGTSVSMVVLGGWFLSHAIWSSRVPEGGPSVRPTLSVSDEHAMLGLTGRF